MELSTTPLYASILALVYVYLSFRTLGLRRANKIAIGDGNNVTLQRAIRVHANFSEYVPMALILITYIEILKFNAILINVLCLSLLIGRISHAYGVSKLQEDFKFRVFGMAMTFSAIVMSSILLILRVLVWI